MKTKQKTNVGAVKLLHAAFQRFMITHCLCWDTLHIDTKVGATAVKQQASAQLCDFARSRE